MSNPGESTWTDLTYPLRPGMPVWPGQPEVSIERIAALSHGDVCNVSVLNLSVHSGTHLDAPVHFLRDAADVTTASLDALNGEATVIELIEETAADGHIRAAHLEAKSDEIGDATRLIVRTRNSESDWTQDAFREDYAAVAPDAAEWLVARGIRTIGVDYLSVAPFDDPTTTHCILLDAGVWIIEALDLRATRAGRIDMRALPLVLVGSDASPIRVVAREI